MPKELLIGADPEYLLVEEKEFNPVCAYKFFAYHGRKIKGKNGVYGSIGRDGNSDTAEIRPSPSRSPNIVTNNIKYLLKKANERLKYRYRFMSGPKISRYSLGGHIHFNKTLSNGTLRLLDQSLYVPLRCIIKYKDGVISRENNGYGKLSYCRDNAWGCEYRTPFSWLFNPSITYAILDLARNIVVNCKDIDPHSCTLFDNKDYAIEMLKRFKCKGSDILLKYIHKDYKFDTIVDFRKSWKI